MADYTTTALIAAIKRRGSFPNSQSLFSNQDLIDIANDELWDTVVPWLMANREEYLVSYKDITLAANEKTIDIPQNAMGMKLRDVVVVTNPGMSQETTYALARTSPDEIASGNLNGSILPFLSSCFYIQNNQVIIWPAPSSETIFRLSFFRRPNQLIATTSCGQVTSVDTNTNEVVLDNVPVSWTAGDTFDIISNTPAFDAVLEVDEAVVVSNPTVQLTDVTGVSVGDWVCLTGESPIAQVPLELHHLLAQAAVVKCLESQKDAEGMQLAQAKLNEMFMRFAAIVSPRVDGRLKCVNSNIGSSVFGNSWRW